MITVRQGSKGDAVRQLQELLGITADGIFGPITKAAVKEYQAANGLKADGIVGPLTWAALLGEEGQTTVPVRITTSARFSALAAAATAVILRILISMT